jgi:hypothetical protein
MPELNIIPSRLPFAKSTAKGRPFSMRGVPAQDYSGFRLKFQTPARRRPEGEHFGSGRRTSAALPSQFRDELLKDHRSIILPLDLLTGQAILRGEATKTNSRRPRTGISDLKVARNEPNITKLYSLRNVGLRRSNNHIDGPVGRVYP